jgi:outer membrane murein-binding lipoprotein Lpp
MEDEDEVASAIRLLAEQVDHLGNAVVSAAEKIAAAIEASLESE